MQNLYESFRHGEAELGEDIALQVVHGSGTFGNRFRLRLFVQLPVILVILLQFQF